MKIKKYVNMIVVLLLFSLTGCGLIANKEKVEDISEDISVDKNSYSDNPAKFFSYINGCWFDLSNNQFMCFYENEQQNENNPYNANIYMGMMNSDILYYGHVKECVINEDDETATTLLRFEEEIEDEEFSYEPFEIPVVLDYSYVENRNELSAYFENLVLNLEFFGPYTQDTMKAMSKALLEYHEKNR